MTLRAKTLLFIGTTLLVLIVSFYLITSSIWLDNFAQLENRAARTNVSRVIAALDDDLNTFDRVVTDWASWDDTYRFIEDHNQAYIQSNLTDETFAQDKVSLMLFVNAAGELVYGRAYDPDNQEMPVPQEWTTYQAALTRHENTDSGSIGIILVNDRLMLAVSRPILTSDYEGPIRGSLVMARYWDDAEFDRLSKITGLSLQAYPAKGAMLPADFQTARSELLAPSLATPDARQQSTLVKPLDEQSIAGYTLLDDLNGQPVSMLRVSAPREIYQQGQSGIRYLLFVLIVVGASFGVLTVAMLDRQLLVRVTRLGQSVNQIGAEGNLAARVPVQGQDELAMLAANLNNMLAALQRAQSVNEQLLEETRRQLGELSVLHTAAIATASSSTLDQALQEIAQATCELFKATNVMVALTRPDGGEVEVRARVGTSDEMLKPQLIPLGQGIIGWVAQTQEPALVPDVSLDARYYNADSRTRSELCVPIKLAQRRVGVINVESERLAAFSERDLQLLTTLAHNLSVIIENIRLLEEIRAANERLKELDRLKSQFLANMSHELRTPLNAIIGFSQLLADGISGSLNDEQREHVDHISASGQHLLALINDVLDLSKMQAGRMVLIRRIVDLADLMTGIQAIIAPLAQRKRQQFNVDLEPGLPPAYADPLRLKQILLNLLSNACKFTPEQGKITLRIALQRGNLLLFSVSDTGLGIPPTQQSAIFEEFQQLSRTNQQGGTGLGLAIARRLVELHGGTIWVESAGRPGLGSTFCFTLPALLDTTCDQLERTTRILIVDDDALLLELLETILPEPDYEVAGLRNAAQARDYLSRTLPDIIILDLLMPETNGFEFLTELRADARTRDIPVLVLTAKILSTEEQTRLAEAAQGVIIKSSLRRDKLLAEIHRLEQTVSEQDWATVH